MTDELFYPPTFWKNKTWKALITSFLSLMLSHGGMFVWKGSKFKIFKYFQEKYFSWLILKIFTKPKKCKLFLKNSIKLIKIFFCSRPGENFFRHPLFWKQEYYFFWPQKGIWSRLYSSVGSKEKWAWTFIHTSWILQYVSEGILFSSLLEGLIRCLCI